MLFLIRACCAVVAEHEVVFREIQYVLVKFVTVCGNILAMAVGCVGAMFARVGFMFSLFPNT